MRKAGLLAVVLVAAATLCAAGGCPGRGRTDTLDRVKQQGVLRWGADPSGGAPFAFFDPADADAKRIIGFECDIMDKLAAHLGVRHELVANDWDALIDNMRSGRTDVVINGIEINEERARQVAFTAPYYLYEQQLTVRLEDKDKYKSVEDLKGHKVATLKAAEANNVLLQAGFAENLIVQLPDSQTPYSELELKRVDGVLQESIIADYYASPRRAPKLHNVAQTFSPGRYAVAVRKEDGSLLAELDRVLALMKQNGELAEIYKRWGIWNARQQEVGIVEQAGTE